MIRPGQDFGERPGMRFEQSIDIDAEQQRVWDVLSDLEAWPRRIETVDVVELLTPAPIGPGSRILLKQPKLPEGTWEVTVWEAPSYFEWRQKSGGISSVAGHRVESLARVRSRLTLSLDMRGLAIPMIGLFYKGLVNRYMSIEADGMKIAAESAET
ncbi:MAG TPA: SRPBCC family protein [Acidimicrobiia bacterium]|nr:SRPBCC family protein [Acidimicrobiia bacterium]